MSDTSKSEVHRGRSQKGGGMMGKVQQQGEVLRKKNQQLCHRHVMLQRAKYRFLL
jgi:hypothetical protein